MHRTTGTFADPAHESVFAARLFRLAFPLHILLLALCLNISVGMLLSVAPTVRPLWVTIGLVGLVGLVSAATYLHHPAPTALAMPIVQRLLTPTQSGRSCAASPDAQRAGARSVHGLVDVDILRPNLHHCGL